MGDTAEIARCWSLYFEKETSFSVDDKRVVLIRGFAEWLANDGYVLLQEVRRLATGGPGAEKLLDLGGALVTNDGPPFCCACRPTHNGTAGRLGHGDSRALSL